MLNKKTLRIIARLNIGGPARNAVLLTEGLRKKGFESILLCGNVDETEGDMAYFAKAKDVNPIIVKELKRNLSVKSDWWAFWDIYRTICKEKPAIIHTHTAKAGTLGRLAGLLYNISHWRKHSTKRTGRSVKAKMMFVHTFHGHVLHSYFGKGKTLFFIWIERILVRKILNNSP